jgi:hypothetical protein
MGNYKCLPLPPSTLVALLGVVIVSFSLKPMAGLRHLAGMSSVDAAWICGFPYFMAPVPPCAVIVSGKKGYPLAMVAK